MKVLLVCSGGMSSAIVVKAIEKEAIQRSLGLTVKSIGASELGDEVKNHWDLILVAPQVRHRLDAFRAIAAEYNIPVALIPPQGYTPLGGNVVMDEILKLVKGGEMKKIFQLLDQYLIPGMTKLSEQRHFQAVRDGIISTIPLIVVGSFFLILAFPPIPALAELAKPYTATILLPFRLTMGLMALYACHSIGYYLAKSYKLDGIAGGMLAMVAFLLTSVPFTAPDKGLVLLMENLGGGGMFVAIIMSFLLWRYCVLLKNIN